MAFVSAGWWLSVTLMDVGYQTTTKQYQLVAADATEAATAQAAVLAALAGVTDLEILSYHTYEKFAEDTVINPTIQKENEALLTFEIDGNPTKHATHSIPGAKNSIYVAAFGPNNNVVDLADAAVIAYAALFIVGAGQMAYISDGESASVITKGHRRNKFNNRG